MARFEPTAGGVALAFEDHEAALLAQLVDEMTELLEQGHAADPAHSRLFPAAYEDPAEAAAFTELVGRELASGKNADLAKIGAAVEILGGNDEVVIARQDIEPWLRVLTDMRLALGTRLDVNEERMARELDPSDPSAASMAVLHWLGWIQESLIEVLTRGETK